MAGIGLIAWEAERTHRPGPQQREHSRCDPGANRNLPCKQITLISLERAVNELDATSFGGGKITVELYTQPGDHSQEFANRRKMCPMEIAHALTGGASSALSQMALLRVERVRRRRDLHQGSVIANDPESTPHSGYSGEESRSAWSNTDLDRNTGVHRNMDLDRNHSHFADFNLSR